MKQKFQNKQTKLEQLLTVQQLADLLQVRKSWVYNRRHAHSLPFPTIKVGGFLRFRREDVESWLWRQRESIN